MMDGQGMVSSHSMLMGDSGALEMAIRHGQEVTLGTVCKFVELNPWLGHQQYLTENQFKPYILRIYGQPKNAQ
jgi:hypothetical protein